MFRMLMPQEQKPRVSTKARVETLLGVAPHRTYSPRQHRPTRPIFRNVAA